MSRIPRTCTTTVRSRSAATSSQSTSSTRQRCTSGSSECPPDPPPARDLGRASQPPTLGCFRHPRALAAISPFRSATQRCRRSQSSLSESTRLSHTRCDKDSYQRRGWTRLEQWARMTRFGTDDMYMYDGSNGPSGDLLEPIKDQTHWYEESIKGCGASGVRGVGGEGGWLRALLWSLSGLWAATSGAAVPTAGVR
eukprot:1706523-Prymnesium_polylepis.1